MIIHKLQKALEKIDSRIKVVPLSGHSWATYDTLEIEGLLKDVEIKQWTDAGMI